MMRVPSDQPQRIGREFVLGIGYAFGCLALGCLSLEETPRLVGDPSLRDLPRAQISIQALKQNRSVRVSRSGPQLASDSSEDRQAALRAIHHDIERIVSAQIEKIFSGPAVNQALTVRMRREDHSNLGWLFASAATLFSLNLVGMPFHHVTQHVEIDVIVGSEGNEKRPRLHAFGVGQAWSAVGWGYSVENAQRLASRRAARDAVRQLEIELTHHAEMIRERLGQ